jgi:FkbM family methyltransferase
LVNLKNKTIIMYVNNKGLKEWCLDESFNDSFNERCVKFGIDKSEVKFYSQQDEDKYIIQYILKDKINDGVFLELGACDGLLYSNTKMLEDHFGFKGILIEPLPNYYKELEKNRSNTETYNYVISNSEEEYINFSGHNAEAGISNLLNNKPHPSYKLPNKKLKDILTQSSFNYIDIFILDVEGAELEVLKSIDFNTFDIYCIFFEAHSNQPEKNKKVGNLLTKKGFIYKDRQRGNEVWVNGNSKRAIYFQ